MAVRERDAGRALWVALGAALAVQLWVLYAPGSPEPSGFDFPGLDKAVHVALFALPAFLIRRVTAHWWPVAALALHAPISELIQWRWVSLRSGDPWDLLADLGGIALGLLAAKAHVSPARG